MDDALDTAHADHGAAFTTVGGQRTVADYGRPATAHRAVRNGVGVIQHPHAVLELRGPDRREVLRAAKLAAPTGDRAGAYRVATDDGRIVAAAYTFAAAERSILVAPPGTGPTLLDRLDTGGDASATMRDDVVVFGVHGPHATEKVASVTPGSAPADRLTFDRLDIADAPATVIRTDAPAGEPGYAIVVDRDEAPVTFDTLLNRGLNAAPFGDRTWNTLTLEAGTPRFHPDFAGRAASLAAHLEGESAAPESGDGPRFVGLSADEPLSAGANLTGAAVSGTITRSARAPSVDREIALAAVEGLAAVVGSDSPLDGTSGSDSPARAVTATRGADDALAALTVDGVSAELIQLPFLASGERSGRCPSVTFLSA